MVKLLTYQSGKTVMKSLGGEKNGKIMPPSEIEITEPLKEIDRWTSEESNEYGTGFHDYTLFTDASGKQIMVHKFDWGPNSGYSWEEAWELVTDDEERIARALRHKVVEEKAL